MEEEEIQRQAALQDVPHERVQQVHEVQVRDEPQTVASCTSSSNRTVENKNQKHHQDKIQSNST
eukprot:1894967-Amphidinium_carterae.4